MSSLFVRRSGADPRFKPLDHRMWLFEGYGGKYFVVFTSGFTPQNVSVSTTAGGEWGVKFTSPEVRGAWKLFFQDEVARELYNKGRDASKYVLRSGDELYVIPSKDEFGRRNWTGFYVGERTHPPNVFSTRGKMSLPSDTVKRLEALRAKIASGHAKEGDFSFLIGVMSTSDVKVWADRIRDALSEEEIQALIKELE